MPGVLSQIQRDLLTTQAMCKIEGVTNTASAACNLLCICAINETAVQHLSPAVRLTHPPFLWVRTWQYSPSIGQSPDDPDNTDSCMTMPRQPSPAQLSPAQQRWPDPSTEVSRATHLAREHGLLHKAATSQQHHVGSGLAPLDHHHIPWHHQMSRHRPHPAQMHQRQQPAVLHQAQHQPVLLVDGGQETNVG